MSLEQAILEHAGALKELAAAIRSTVRTATVPENAAIRETSEKVAAEKAIAAQKAAESNKAIAAADAELEKAVSEVEKAACADQKELSYNADVLPLLMKLNKIKGKDALVALLGHFEAAKGDKIKPEQFADVIAYVEEKLAA